MIKYIKIEIAKHGDIMWRKNLDDKICGNCKFNDNIENKNLSSKICKIFMVE